MIVEENRIGRFFIADNMLRQHPDMCLCLLSKVLIIRAEMSFYKNAVEYLGFSEAFDACEKFVTPPDYDLAYETETDIETGEVKRTPIGFVRVK